MDRPFIIINNVAAKARQAAPIVKASLEQRAIKFDFHETSGAGDATTQARAALKRGCRTIAVVGGDGTLSEAAEGFFEFRDEAAEFPSLVNSEASLAILPAGTGDDVALGLLGRRARLEEWIDIFTAHCYGHGNVGSRVVDVLYGRCNEYSNPFICINASTMGLGAETAARVGAQGPVLRNLSGKLRFVAGAIGALAAWRERRVRVSLDSQTIADSDMNLVAVANGLYAGGGMMLSPQAQNNDGKLDVITATGLTRANVVRELTRIHRGGHVANSKVKVKQGRYARIETFSPHDALLVEADGNVRGRTPVEFRLMPRALRFVVSADYTD